MRVVKILLTGIVILGLIAAGYIFGMKSGADLVRNGMVQDYPVIKTLVTGSMVDFDSTVDVSLTMKDDSALFNYLKGTSKSDTIRISIPAYTRYGIDMAAGSVRPFEREDALEIWVPAIKLVYCELRFDRLLVKGQPGAEIMNKADGPAIRRAFYNYFIPLLNKHKSHIKAAKNNVAKSLMFYFIPFKFNLKVYIDNEQWPLPIVPGVNKSVDEAIRESLGK
jgi:hypothetical protein